MKDKQNLTVTKKEWQMNGSGFKVIKAEISVPSESIYAVCTPVKRNN